MGIERPDDPDVPPDGDPDDRSSAAGDGGKQPGSAQAETRYRQECYVDLRNAAAIEERTEPSGRAEPGARSKPLEPDENKQQAKPAENGQQAKASASWEETANLGRWMWGEYKRKWPPEERPPVDRSDDPPGSWRGDNVRFLSPADNAKSEQEYDGVADRERETVSPRMHEVESRDPRRHLIGSEYCLKDPDRVKEKIFDNMKEFTISATEAASIIPDAIRYTFQYEETRYTQGVRADLARLKDQGFKLDKLKNFWSDDQYKGINSQWIEPDTGQRFEVQFHTRISFESKQLTHGAYERLRTLQTDEFEDLVLEAFQKKFSAEVPVPPGATTIPDYPKRANDAR
jgi:hypothetical protein